MVDNWQKFDSWIHTQKILILIIAILVFYPILYFLFYPNIGAVGILVMFFIFLIIITFLIKIWGKVKFKDES